MRFKCRGLSFHPDGELLVSTGWEGVYRLWHPSSGRLLMQFPRMLSAFGFSKDGRWLSEAGGGALLVDLQTGSVQGPLKPHERAGFVAISPDGQWLATAGQHSDKALLWNIETGKIVREWKQRTLPRVSFTPDSRTVALSASEEFTFWDVEFLREICRIPCDVPLYRIQVIFSSDGRLMAMEMSPGIIHLKEVATGRTVARLEDLHGDRVTWMKFTPDDAQLVAASNYAKGIHSWDLRAIRARLKEMGLDWDWPEFPQRTNRFKSDGYPDTPLKIEVILPPTTNPKAGG